MSLLLKNYVAADKTGDWERRLMIVEKLIPILEQRGSINYLRYVSFYLEMMPKLPEQIFEIYEQFLKVTFVVKSKPGIFNGIASDMKLETTKQK